MSYQLLSETQPIARKDYPCVWCPETILKGFKYVREVSKYDGWFQDHHWHPECYLAAKEFFREYGEDEFPPREFKRGTIEERDFPPSPANALTP